MKRLVLSAILVFMMTSCKETYKPKDIYEEKFLEYVKTDFGNPKDFMEITKAEYDTITSDEAIKMLDLYREIFFLFNDETKETLRQLETDARETKGMVHIIYKVRMRDHKDVIVNTYFGSYNLDNGECIFGDNKEDYHLLPQVYYDILDFTEDFLDSSNLRGNTNYY